MIEEIVIDDGDKKYLYKPPKSKELEKRFKNLITLFKNYQEENDIEGLEVQSNFKLINEINIRVDKRKDYYSIFHKGVRLSEVRKAALIAFWILKFKPFLVASEDGRDYNLNLNCGFAAYIILGAASEWIEIEHHGKKKLKLSDEYLNKFQYALKYWDLSKEAMMLIAETLCFCITDKEEE